MTDEYEGGDRSGLAHEGNAMLRLILGRTPSRRSVGEYVDAIGAIGDGSSLGLPHWALAPGVLTLFQGPILFRRGLMQAVRRRMDIAFQIGETEPAPSRYLLIAIGMTETFRMVCSAIVGSVLAALVGSRSPTSW
jgi:hypothetical protein